MLWTWLVRVLGSAGLVTILAVSMATDGLAQGCIACGGGSVSVAVTPDGGSTPARYANTGPYTATFTVRHTGTEPGVTFAITCSGSNVVCTSRSPTSVTLNPQQITNIVATYSVQSGASGLVSVTASAGAVSDQGQLTVPIITPNVNITAPPAVSIPTGQSGSLVFTVLNTGGQSETYSFGCDRTGPVSCGTVAPSSTSIPSNQFVGVAVPFTANVAPGTATLTLRAAHNATGAVKTASTGVTVQHYDVTVIAVGGTTAPPRQAGTTGHAQQFDITNGGSTSNAYTFGCQKSSNITNCAPPGSVPINPGATTRVAMTYDTPMANISSWVQLTATGNAGGVTVTDNAQVNFAVHRYGAIITSASGASPQYANTGPYTHVFGVQNDGTTFNTYTVSCTGPGGGACTPQGSTSVGLSSGATQAVTVSYAVGATSGPVTLTAQGDGGASGPNTSDEGSQQVTVLPVDFAVTTVSDPAPTVTSGGATTATFQLSNNGSLPDDYTLSCVGISPCSIQGINNRTVDPFSLEAVDVQYTVGGPGVDTLTLTAEGAGGATQSSSVVVTIATYGVIVSVKDPAPAERFANSSGYQHAFWIKNTGSQSNTYTLTCNPLANVTCDPLPVMQVTVPPGDSTAAVAAYDVSSEPSGEVGLSATGAGNVSDGASVTFPINLYAVTVTAQGSPASLPEQTPGHTQAFTVSNPGQPTITYQLTCSDAGPVMCDQATMGPITMVGHADSTVLVGFSVGTVGTGSLQLAATGSTGPGGIADSASVIVSITLPLVVVTPDGSTEPPHQVGEPGVVAFLVTNNLGADETFTFQCLSGGSVTCAGLPQPSSIEISGNGGVVTVDVPFIGTAVGAGTLALIADDFGLFALDTGTVSQPIEDFEVTVTPADSVGPARTEKGKFVESFTVTNTGTALTTFDLECEATGEIQCVDVQPQTMLADGASAQIPVTFRTVALSDTNTLALTATSIHYDGATATGKYTIPIRNLAVAVSPRSRKVGVGADEAQSQTFIVTNGGSGITTFLYELTCQGAAVIGCSTSSFGATLDPQEKHTVVVSYTSSASLGHAGAITFVAQQAGDPSVADTGTVLATVGYGQAPLLSVNDAGPGTTVARSLCLTVAVAPNAAMECGTVRMAHALPAVRTLNKVRTPVFIYNSGVAHPRPAVGINVFLPNSAVTPDSVVGRLLVGSVEMASQAWDGAVWSPGRAARVVLSYDGWSQLTGTYDFTVELIAHVGNAAFPVTAGGELAVVNRKWSRYGAGWWIAGLEQLYFLAGSVDRILWAGGDGSAHVYEPAAADIWVGPGLTWPDTLRLESVGNGSFYVRRVRGGTEIRYDLTGRHVQTVTRLGHVTRFAYDASVASQPLDEQRVASIWVPLPDGDSLEAYRFVYGAGLATSTNPARWRIDSVLTLPGTSAELMTRTLRAGSTQNGPVMDRFVDPDGSEVQFGWWAPPYQGRVKWVEDRGDTRTTFDYDAASRLARAVTPVGGDSLVMTVRPFETVGLMAAADTADAYALLDGPRTDVGDSTRLWMDRFGAPVRIVDAGGAETVVEKGDARFPVLATRVTVPSGAVSESFYGASGNPDSTRTIDSVTATTTYQWLDPWDVVAKATAPGGEISEAGYDPATGNRLWQQDGRGTASRVTFGYDPGTGLVGTIDPPLTPAEAIVYDSLGNVTRSISALGFIATTVRDAYGRDSVVVTPIDSMQTQFSRALTLYDLAGRPVEQVTWTDLDLDSLIVRTRYDAAGNTLSVSRRAAPDLNAIDSIVTRWEYDVLGRVVAEIAPDGRVDSTFYDSAGNAVAVKTRRGHALTMEYDALNRLTRRIVPEVVEAKTTYSGLFSPYPRYPNDGGSGLRIAADTAVYTYDESGNTVRARNGDAIVVRAYDRLGRIVGDTTYVRSYDRADSLAHVYGLEFGYDINGRRTWMKHPAALAPAATGADSISYAYNPLTGALQVVERLGQPYGFEYDAQGRLERTTWPGGIEERREYDADSRLVRRYLITDSTGPNGGQFPDSLVAADTLYYDARGRILQARELQAITGMTYAGLGALAASSTDRFDLDTAIVGPATFFSTESYTTDALGNVQRMQRDGRRSLQTLDVVTEWTTNTYERGTGRLVQRLPQDFTLRGDTTVFDAAGNRKFYSAAQGTVHQGGFVEGTRYYYGADEKLRVVDKRTCSVQPNPQRCDPNNPVGSGDRGVFEEYRYDPLGRRILARGRSMGCSAYNCPDYISRTVWDGDQILYEARYPGHDTVSTILGLEQDTGVVDLRISVWECTPGAACDTSSQIDCATVLAPIHGCYLQIYPPTFYPYGVVGYVHGPGLDAPLAIERQYRWADEPGLRTTVPLPNWKGDYAAGADLQGRAIDCSVDTPAPDCLDIEWPAIRWWHSYQYRQFDDAGQTNWLGSLVDNKRDGSGLLYMRNRYYDPATGQFTQEDPIGIAGGLNLYGFAGGDPVNFSDPFGLCPIPPSNCLDIVFLAWDVVDYVRDPSITTAAGVGLGIAALIPGIPSFTAARRGGRVLSSGGQTVIGHYPGYIKKARDLGARYFDVPTDVWDAMNDAERWGANKKFLDRAINRADDVILSTPINRVDPKSWTRQEIDYLLEQGYKLSQDGTKLIPGS